MPVGSIERTEKATDAGGSRAAERVVKILDFFAGHPGESFTLTELARALRISPATCLSILTTLVSANYLIRDQSKRYMVGPALGRLAQAEVSGGGALRSAKAEMRILADRYDVICSAIFPEDGEAVVRERASSISHLGWADQLGRRFPLSPPLGAVFYAWEDQAAIDKWVASSSNAEGAIDEGRIRGTLAFTRRCGFAIGFRTEPLQGVAHAKSLASRVDKTDYLIDRIVPDSTYSPAFVAAPVFDGQGRPSFALALMGFTTAMSGEQIMGVGQTITDSCARVTQAAGGAVPGNDPG